jgi:hypothetical protein
MIKMRGDQNWTRRMRTIFSANEKVSSIIPLNVQFRSARRKPTINPSHHALFMPSGSGSARQFEQPQFIAAGGKIALAFCGGRFFCGGI